MLGSIAMAPAYRLLPVLLLSWLQGTASSFKATQLENKLDPSSPNHQTVRQNGDQLRLLLCVTGQQGRLEIESKMKKFVNPHRDNGHIVDIVLVMDDGETKFVNYDAEEVNPYSHNPVPKDAKLVNFSQPENPEVQLWYVDRLVTVGKDYISRRDRAMMHVRQLSSVARCYDEMLKMEEENGEKYDEILRIRDDGYLLKNVPLLHEINSKPGIATCACDSWRGVNDKGTLFLRKFAKTVLTGPLLALTQDNESSFSKDPSINNPETLIYSVFRSTHASIDTDSNILVLAPIRLHQYHDIEKCLDMMWFGGCWECRYRSLINQTTVPRCPIRDPRGAKTALKHVKCGEVK